MAPARAGSALGLWIAWAAARGAAPAVCGALDAEGLIQTDLLSSRRASSGEGLQRPPHGFDKAWKALERHDVDALTKMVKRQQSAEEIESTVRAVRNYTDTVKQLPDLVEEAMEPLGDFDVDLDQSGNHTQALRLLAVAFESVERLAHRHYEALAWTFDVLLQNNPQLSPSENAMGQATLKLLAKRVVEVAAHARLAAATARGSDELCREASGALSELRQHLRSWGKLCDGILAKLPPPLPPTNPWMNSTLLEATRSMYSNSRGMLRDMDDAVVDSVSSFIHDALGCDVKIVTRDMDLQEIGQHLARLHQDERSQPPQQSGARHGLQPGLRICTAASLMSLALLTRSLGRLSP